MSISKEIMLEMYKRMDQVRKFEEKVSEFFAKGMIHGTTHLSIGQEASGVPAVMALEDGDLVTLTHRGHAMSIGMGIDLNKMMAELMGKATGFCKGKGGSMHIVDVDAGNLGSNGVVGGGMLPKLKNCIEAIEGGVSRVHILDGRLTNCLLLEFFTEKGIGTAILKEPLFDKPLFSEDEEGC